MLQNVTLKTKNFLGKEIQSVEDKNQSDKSASKAGDVQWKY